MFHMIFLAIDTVKSSSFPIKNIYISVLFSDTLDISIIYIEIKDSHIKHCRNDILNNNI